MAKAQLENFVQSVAYLNLTNTTKTKGDKMKTDTRSAVEKLKQAVVNYRNWELDEDHYEQFQDGKKPVYTFREVFTGLKLQFRHH
mgnify:CR=1 FL=1